MTDLNTAKRKEWPMSYVRACMAFGNGDVGRGQHAILCSRGGLKRPGKSIPGLPKMRKKPWRLSVKSGPSSHRRWIRKARIASMTKLLM